MDATIRNLDDETWRALTERAEAEGRPVEEILTDAVRSYAARFPVKRGGVHLWDLKPIPFPEGNEHLSEEIDSIVYGDER